MIKCFLLFFLAANLVACGAGPGAPLVRHNVTDAEGPMVPGCQNISKADTTLDFITKYYLTTWGSASREGSAAGKYEGAKRGYENLGIEVDDEQIRAFAYGSLPASDVFCKTYAAENRQIYKILEQYLAGNGYRWDYVNKAEGLYITEYVYREPEAPAWMKNGIPHKWKDRFFIDIEQLNNGQAVVRVNRDIYISRRDKGIWSDYIRATSVGHNEAVILNIIDQELSRL